MPEIKINNKNFPIDELYQPIYRYGEDIESITSRSCNDRLYTILQAEYGFNFNKIFESNITDWGCSLGFFTLSLAEKTKGVVYGIDHDIKNINFCNELKAINKIENVEFIKGTLPYDNITSKSYFILSILHHFQHKPEIPENVLNIISKADTVYLEMAHYLEYPGWAENLIPEEKINPYLFWLKKLEEQLPEFVIRLIGVHKTHLGSLRPMYLCKRKLNEKYVYNKDEFKVDGIIYDRFQLPYVDFGDFAYKEKEFIKEDQRLKNNVNYAFLKQGDKDYFIKFKNNILVKVEPYIDGFLLSTVIKFGMLPYYDRLYLKQQLSMYTNNNENKLEHNDPHAWNFIVDENSNIHAIDGEDNSMLCKDCLSKNVQILIQNI